MHAPHHAEPVTTPRDVTDWRAFAQRGLWVSVVSASLTLLVNYALGQSDPVRLLRALTYGQCISILSWFFIDGGRLLLPARTEDGWPKGWWGLALPVLGCALGFAAGSALADTISGYPIYSGYLKGVRSLKADLIVSMLIGAGFSSFFYLRGKTAHQQARLQRAERDLNLARLSMLQAQLEPHMLFNTLANLRVLIGLDAARAQAMLDHMIAYLRATLDGSRATWHPLSNEFERLADYLALMAVRMGPRLQVRLDLPDALRRLPVPPMLLQPLVENCIKHGLEPKVAGGAIEVSAAQVGEHLVLAVRDTGVGLMSSAAAGSPLAAAAGPQPSGDARFGVAQVRERLAALYGGHAEFTLEPADDARGGTLARLLLPINPDAPGAQSA